MGSRLVLGCVCAALAAAAPSPALAGGPKLPAHAAKAGVAVLDASWHVGAASGSHGSKAGLEDLIAVHGMDPARHSITRVPSYGIQSRLDVRALVVQGANGKHVALVKNDLFIPQDLLWRRTAQILEEDASSGITRDNLTMAVTHDHSSPYHSSPDWGVAAASQDAFDARFYEYYAERMAAAVEEAAKDMKPVRVGAAVTQFDKTARNSMGGEYTDDGTPGGYWANDTDHNLTVVRFDDVSNPSRPKPLAILMNYAMHPETLPSGLNLITGDYVAPLERMVDRESGATLIFTQGAVGTSEPEESDYDQPYDSWHSIHDRLEFHYKGYEAGERAAGLLADTALGTWRDIAAGTPQDPARYVPFQTGFPVGTDNRWFPGPLSHPYPSFGNCKLDPAVQGHPRAPTDLPTCEQQDVADTGVSTDPLKQAGVPVPDHWSPPAYTGLEEDLGVHLQAFRLGDILFTVCSCEQWKDQSQNIRTRTDRQAFDEYLGYDFSKECNRNADATWSCPDPFHQIRLGRKDLPPVSDAVYQRMKAEVNNDARGWDQLAYAPFAESEPDNPADIKGNYTQDDTPENATYGYGLTVPISMANDYNGYLATYREYQNRDHYRKSLTGWGPHSSDYFATRMVEMGRHLNG
ncbi:MAG: neutral/alkaline non-lysosomal ceramidase N-terminal domain-containing protein, partial [Thermoleophilaceae bacterium]